MEDLIAELRKLDPSRLISALHYTKKHPEGARVQIDYWDEIRMVPSKELPKAWAAELDVEVVVIEIKCPSDKFWVIVPVKFPNTRYVKKIHCSTVISLEEAWKHFGVRGEFLCRDRDDLVPEGVIPVMGDFYAKH